ncbi:hypothetical protein EV196_10722 [Mariniflexile fucanivorans]|uniref:DUF5723 domain-containing protein n=1 Tax=Mariniflexile fucanivorans TaxID=264023 RepID=A0A4V2QDG7_9FLAO|nr:DUF5723 family protein [Mariniflexile fucanivorans]TCL64317.1 hypothetical protein EV196_10722 [Mariniflexile fucanivorans]
MRYLAIIFLVTGMSFAQNKQILYGFSEIPQTLMLNPGGQINNSGYFGLPFVSHIHASAGISGFTVYDLFANNGVDFNIKLRDAIYNSKPRDFGSINQQVEILSGGFAIGNIFKKNEYISFGLYQELDGIWYFPKDYAILALEGNQNNINKVFNASHLKLSGEVISVLHVGYNKKVNNQFSYGVRGKIYSNILNVNSIKNRGTFVTEIGDNNIYNHIFNLDLELRTSGIAGFEDSEADDVYRELKKRTLMGGDKGLGFDIGFSHQISKQWYVDGSLLDIGFINHSKDVENYSIKGTYQFEGINPFFSELETGQTANDYWNKIQDEFSEVFEPDTTYTKFTTWRPIKLNASLNYAFGEKKEKECNCIKKEKEYQNRIGAQLYAINRPRQPQAALTLYYYRKLFKGLSMKTTYTADSYSLNNIGFGLSANLANVNFYVMADNLLQYKNIYDAQSVSLQLGFNYIFKKNED